MNVAIFLFLRDFDKYVERIERNIDALKLSMGRLTLCLIKDTGVKAQKELNFLNGPAILEIMSIEENLGNSNMNVESIIEISNQIVEFYSRYRNFLIAEDLQEFIPKGLEIMFLS